ncbi:ATP-citrate synthase alpha chain protein 3 [Nymphaea thermarum]|nr:ATP-citrate synthase alpha chain protein 3 [Nymphaea thermarum]
MKPAEITATAFSRCCCLRRIRRPSCSCCSSCSRLHAKYPFGLPFFFSLLFFFFLLLPIDFAQMRPARNHCCFLLSPLLPQTPSTLTFTTIEGLFATSSFPLSQCLQVRDLVYASKLRYYVEYSGAPNGEEVLQYARVVLDTSTTATQRAPSINKCQ